MSQLHAKAVEWNVTLNEIRETPTSLIGFGVRDDVRVVLKVAKQEGDESHSGEVLKAYGGEGTARVYESETGAVLLERLEPGEQLVNVVKGGEDDKATKILAEVIAKRRRCTWSSHHHSATRCCYTAICNTTTFCLITHEAGL